MLVTLHVRRDVGSDMCAEKCKLRRGFDDLRSPFEIDSRGLAECAGLGLLDIDDVGYKARHAPTLRVAADSSASRIPPSPPHASRLLP